jgi:hypothetical protein
MQGIDQNASVPPIRSRHDTDGVLQTSNGSPPHELQVNAEAKRRRKVAEFRKRTDKALPVGIVARHNNAGRAEVCTAFEQLRKRLYIDVRYQWDELNVMQGDALASQEIAKFPMFAGARQGWIRDPACGHRVDSKTNRLEPNPGRFAHEVGRCKFQRSDALC